MNRTIFAAAAAAFVSLSTIAMAGGQIYTCRTDDGEAVAYAKPAGGGYIVEVYKTNPPRQHNMACNVDWSGGDVFLNCTGTEMDGSSRSFVMRRDLSFDYFGSGNIHSGRCGSRNFGD